MQRRDVLKAVVGTAAVAMTASVVAATEDHEHHHDHGASGVKEFAGIIDSSSPRKRTFT
ncbi:hypothetical protein [Pseudomonas putida]|uniref:hypothetical protein n=1 Tax=Pseudomonas putida TaxID=303 RepID=UPI0039E03446